MTRVMIVEDDFIIADEIAAIIADAGYTVVGPMGTIEEAEAQLSGPEHPDFVVVDANIRNRSSARLAHRLRDAGIPFCVCTGYRLDDLRSAFGEVTVVQKPVDRRALVSVIRAGLPGST
jgi:DNA-binding response OmpR family regulator